MGLSKINIYYWFVLFGLFFTLAFTPGQGTEPANPVLCDDFSYLNDTLMKGAYTAWKDGADVTVSLEKNYRKPGNSAMRVEITGPNQRTGSKNASIYRVLQLFDRNWTNGSAVRFWLENPSDLPLLLSFNFKEEFNEYWATTGSGVYFLEGEDGILLKKRAEYGNLPIPSQYKGYVVIPFYSFAVPDWNTARGNQVLDLGGIESYAFGIGIDQDYPRHFYVDDFEITQTAYSYLEIQGSDSIEVPPTGERREQFSVKLISPVEKTSHAVTGEWSLLPPSDPAIQIDNDGWLVIPTSLKSQNITLVAAYQMGKSLLKDEFAISLIGSQGPASEAAPEPTKSENLNPALKEKTAYEQFSQDFEKWSYENRPLFVILSITVVLVILFILSYFQRRLR